MVYFSWAKVMAGSTANMLNRTLFIVIVLCSDLIKLRYSAYMPINSHCFYNRVKLKGRATTNKRGCSIVRTASFKFYFLLYLTKNFSQLSFQVLAAKVFGYNFSVRINQKVLGDGGDTI